MLRRIAAGLKRARWSLLEAVGIFLLIAFAFAVWPPLALAAGGVLAIAVAVLGESRSTTDDPEANP